jgi:hypothetical protein
MARKARTKQALVARVAAALTCQRQALRRLRLRRRIASRR